MWWCLQLGFLFMMCTIRCTTFGDSLLPHQHLQLCSNSSHRNGGEVRCRSGHHRHQQCTGGAIPKSFSHVRVLSLCNLPGPTFNPQILAEAKNLRNFALMYGNVSNLSVSFPSSFKNVHVLIISHLNITDLSEDTFQNMDSLKTLDLSANRLTHFNESFLHNFPNLEKVFLSDNPYICTNSNMKDYLWLINDTRVEDRMQMTCAGNLYTGKPIVPILNLLQSVDVGCPEKCSCEMSNVVWGTDKRALYPLITVNCENLGLTELPATLPANTTTLNVQNNKISNLRPLSENPFYFNLADLYLNNNLVSSIALLEGVYWLNNFRVLSLSGNQLQQIPTYILDNALQRNGNVARLYLSKNPWTCDCQFTPVFQDLLVKYQTILTDIDDIRCASVPGDENSLAMIRTLSITAVCRLPSDFLIEPLDMLNIVLASLIVLILGKLAYDYYSFKKTGKLPWIVMKMP